MAEGRGPLRLLAEDAEDLGVIAAALQDAVAKLGDIAWEASARRLTIGFNRYRWEAASKTRERVRTGLQFGGVLAVRSRKLKRDAPSAVVELLTLGFEPGEAPGGTITLTFAGGADLKLEVECVEAVLSDVSEAWPARRAPQHE
ncbi:DUF2948 family protein [Phenylobacterium montanum]|uniref:DUF2948 family protein n=1 Tax=Phenylobacterium montanum TaxID=2823693 RepID=A0A975G1R2_9CAUL|nr:DUF2948 family protein [Caulobacter sp. S6]QUD89179.1 DUF2948 family protein [Caulobacter sp. S6]